MDNYAAIAAKAPAEYLARLISVAGSSDPATFERVRAFLQSPGRRSEYGDERDPAQRARLAEISPLRNVGKIRIPLMVAAGAYALKSGYERKRIALLGSLQAGSKVNLEIDLVARYVERLLGERSGA